jgi:AraC family transcriptional activator of pobA
LNGLLDFFHYDTLDPSRYMQLHKHNSFELVYYVKGRGTMNLNGEKLRFVPNSMTLTRPHFLHDQSHDELTEVIYFGFHYDDSPVYLPNGLIYDTEQQDILRLVTRMKEEFLGQKLHYTLTLNLLLNEVILLIDRQLQGTPAAKSPEKLQFVKRFIDENYKQAINIRTLSEKSGYSDEHFRHLFKEYTGMSPSNYILHKRLEAAKQLLLLSASSISDIAMECGFSTTSHFIGLFKRTYGKTPLQYRLSGGVPHFDPGIALKEMQ